MEVSQNQSVFSNWQSQTVNHLLLFFTRAIQHSCLEVFARLQSTLAIYKLYKNNVDKMCSHSVFKITTILHPTIVKMYNMSLWCQLFFFLSQSQKHNPGCCCGCMVYVTHDVQCTYMNRFYLFKSLPYYVSTVQDKNQTAGMYAMCECVLLVYFYVILRAHVCTTFEEMTDLWNI